jgi:hypothetical protein
MGNNNVGVIMELPILDDTQFRLMAATIAIVCVAALIISGHSDSVSFIGYLLAFASGVFFPTSALANNNK